MNQQSIRYQDLANYTITKWVYTIAKIFGYWPFSVDMINRDRHQSLQINIRNGLWSLVVALVYIIIFIFKTSGDEMQRLQLTETDIRLTKGTHFVYVSVLVSSIFLNFYNRRNLRQIDIINLNFDQRVI